MISCDRCSAKPDVTNFAGRYASPGKCVFHYLFWAHEDSGDPLWMKIPLNVITLLFNAMFFGSIGVMVLSLIVIVIMAFTGL